MYEKKFGKYERKLNWKIYEKKFGKYMKRYLENMKVFDIFTYHDWRDT